jgi:ABC-type glycerol-3-phosphate transport system permease component
MLKRILIPAAATIGVLLYLFPYTWMVLSAFRQPVDTLSIPPKFLFDVTLDGFFKVFRQTPFAAYLLNSLFVTTLSVIMTICIATPASYALIRIRRGGNVFLLTVLVAKMIPAIALAVPIYILGSLLRQLDTYQVLIAINIAFNLPFAVWMIRGFFADLPENLIEAALIDGASEWEILRKVAVPLSLGGILATAVFVFVACWNEFLFALILTGGQATTAPVALLSFRSSYGVEWDMISAGAFMVSLPVIVFAFIMQRYLVGGLTMGAVK